MKVKMSRGRALIYALCLVPLCLSACEDPDERAQKYLDRGKSLFESGDLERARLEFSNAIRIDPTNGLSSYYLGRIYESKRQWREAFQSYLQASTRLTKHFDANLRLGRMYVLSGFFWEI